MVGGTIAHFDLEIRKERQALNFHYTLIRTQTPFQEDPIFSINPGRCFSKRIPSPQDSILLLWMSLRDNVSKHDIHILGLFPSSIHSFKPWVLYFIMHEMLSRFIKLIQHNNVHLQYVHMPFNLLSIYSVLTHTLQPCNGPMKCEIIFLVLVLL